MAVDTKLLTASLRKLLNFRTKPVTIKQYLEDEYYLGKFFAKDEQLYPRVREIVIDFFNDDILNKTQILCLGGSTGWGKSSISSVAINYILYKFDCLEDPYTSLAHNRFNTAYKVKCVHFNQKKAWDKQVLPQLKLFEESPYWKDRAKLTGMKTPWNVEIEASTKLTHALSDETIVAHITEANFFKTEFVKEMVDGMISRIANRFQLGAMVFPLVILDTSTKYSNSFLEDFINNSEYKDESTVYYRNNWEVREFLGIFDSYDRFKIFTGTSDEAARVIEDDSELEKLDVDRVIDNIPKTPLYYKMAKSNIEKFLQDYAGVAVELGSKFFQDPSIISKSITTKNIYNHDIVIDELNDDRITDIISLESILRLLPEDAGFHIGVDVGLTDDKTGFAICYADSYKEVKLDERIVEPILHITVPFVLRFSRKSGQETPLDKIGWLVAELVKKRKILSFTADQYQSRQLMQQVRRFGVDDSSLLSKDRDDKAYQSLKLKMRRGEITLPDHPILRLELQELEYIDGKVDHKYSNSKIDGQNGKGSKDIADSLASVVYKCIEYGKDNFGNFNQKMELQRFNNLLDALTERYRMQGMTTGGVTRIDLGRR